MLNEDKKLKLTNLVKLLVEKVGLDNLEGFCLDHSNLDITIKNSQIENFIFTAESIGFFINELKDIYGTELDKLENANKIENSPHFKDIFKQNFKMSSSKIGLLLCCITPLIFLPIMNGISAFLLFQVPIISFFSSLIFILFMASWSAGEAIINRKTYGDKREKFEQYKEKFNKLDIILEQLPKQQSLKEDPISRIQEELRKLSMETEYHEVGDMDIEHSKGQMTLGGN